MLEVLSVRPISIAEVRTGIPLSRYSRGDPATVRRNAPPLASLLSEILRPVDLLACRARSSLPSNIESFGVTGDVPYPSEPASPRLRTDFDDVAVFPPVMKACAQRRWFAVTLKCSRCGEKRLMSGRPNTGSPRQWAVGVPTLPTVQPISTLFSLPPNEDDM